MRKIWMLLGVAPHSCRQTSSKRGLDIIHRKACLHVDQHSAVCRVRPVVNVANSIVLHDHKLTALRLDVRDDDLDIHTEIGAALLDDDNYVCTTIYTVSTAVTGYAQLYVTI